MLDARQHSGGATGDVKTYDVGPAGQHTEGEVDYEQNPPAGASTTLSGRTAASTTSLSATRMPYTPWSTRAVWITYSPDLPQDQVDELRGIAESQSYVLVSPYPDLPSNTPVVASAWGKQIGLSGSDDPDLESFIQAYQQGPQTPEPGAVAPAARARRCNSVLRTTPSPGVDGGLGTVCQV